MDGDAGEIASYKMRKKMIKFTIPFIGPSLNEYIRLDKFKRNTLTKDWHVDIGYLVNLQKISPVSDADYPIKIKVSGFFGPNKRRFDSDNLVGLVKLIVDGLVKAGILVNDSPKYIASIELIPLKTKDESYTLIEIAPASK